MTTTTHTIDRTHLGVAASARTGDATIEELEAEALRRATASIEKNRKLGYTVKSATWERDEFDGITAVIIRMRFDPPAAATT